MPFHLKKKEEKKAKTENSTNYIFPHFFGLFIPVEPRVVWITKRDAAKGKLSKVQFIHPTEYYLTELWVRDPPLMRSDRVLSPHMVSEEGTHADSIITLCTISWVGNY